MTKRQCCIVVNPIACRGKALKVLARILPTLKRLPILYRVVVTESIAHAQTTARAAAQMGECVAVLGGDGSLRAVASVMPADGVLAIIPAGRGNDMARALGIPLHPERACRLLADGQVKVIDAASVNGHLFLSICSLGFDSVANRYVAGMRWLNGRLVYLIAGLRALMHWQPVHFNITIDGEHFAHEGYTVAVANASTYGGGMVLAPSASLTDGLLDVVLIGAVSKLRLLRNIPRVFNGTHVHAPGYKVLRGRHIEITAEPSYALYADGDYICAPPATIEIANKRLQVLVP